MKRGKRLRNEGAVNEDRISQLPEALILQILSSLETYEVVATSALSQQWRHVWKMIPKLEFYSHTNKSEHETFSNNVSRLLLSHKDPVLESLHLCFNLDNCDVAAIGMWIGIAYARHLRKLVISVDSDECNFSFPSCLYNCETLETLELDYCIIDVPSPVRLNSLVTLHLGVDYKDEASVVNLLAGCPKLENLVVKRYSPDVDIFTIAVPSLQRLTIYDDYNWGQEEEIGGYVINAPSLKYLKIEGLTGLNFQLIEMAPELVEVVIIDVEIKMDEKLLGSLTSVKRLSLTHSPLEITFPTSTIFYQLEYLELSTELAEWWNLLLLMLYSSPKLQVLKLIGQSCDVEEFVACEKWNQRENVSECLKSLRTLHLDHLDYKDDALILNLLSGCPNLENLVVNRYIHDVDVFIIALPSLERLTIWDRCDRKDDSGGYMVNAPSLKYLEIVGFKGLPFRLNENARDLVEAKIIDVSKSVEKLLRSLTSVKRLSLASSPSEITFPTGSIFYRLEYLELSTRKAEWSNLLFLMLDCSPKLQVLKLNGYWYSDKKDKACKKWNQPQSVSECLMLHLETFVWNAYIEQVEEEKRVAKYILRNANKLKKATCSVRDLNFDERLKMHEELENVISASNPSCKLLVHSQENF